MAENFVVYSEEQLAELFDSQLAVLRRSGADEAVVGQLRSQRNTVVSQAKDTAFPEGHLPFAPKLTAGGRIEYVYDVPPRPAGLLSADPGVGAIAVWQSASAALAAVPAPAPLVVAQPVGSLDLFALRSRQAILAYGRRSDDLPLGSIIDLYA